MTAVMKTEWGEEHGMIKEVANSVHDNGFQHMKPEAKAKAEKLRKEDAKIVKARYINHRGQNERLDKPYCRYAGDPIRTYHLVPNQVYELPKGFVDEVNGNPGLAVRSEVLDASGRPTVKDGNPMKIHELVPCSF